MIVLYKKWKNKVNTTRCKLDTFNHDWIGNNTFDKTIWEVLLLKCLFFNNFEKIIRDLLIITLPFLIKFS